MYGNYTINKIYRYQLLNEYGLGDCFQLDESFVNKRLINLSLDLVHIGLKKLKTAGSVGSAERFASQVKKIWKSVDLRYRVIAIITLLTSMALVPLHLTSDVAKQYGYAIFEKNGNIELVEDGDNTQNGNDAFQMNSVVAAKSFRMSDSGLDLIRDKEKFKSRPYYATKHERRVGKKTIGYGHVIKPSDPAWIRNAVEITQEQADAILRLDIRDAELAVERTLGNYMDDNQKKASFYPQSFIDVLISITYNAGPTGFVNSPIFAKIKTIGLDANTNMANMDDFDDAAKAIKVSCIRQKGKILQGLVNRRAHEYQYVYDKLNG